uniref:Glycolipid transfer protein domain-containing protein n=1 Tax=Setaria digitata TaxID=48799 RepID=A0A915PZT4_9BILA
MEDDMVEEVMVRNNGFDIDLVTELFKKSLVGDNDVSLLLYIDAYRQINRDKILDSEVPCILNSKWGTEQLKCRSMFMTPFPFCYRLFSLLSKGFSFIENDLLEKEKILMNLHTSDPIHYDTVNKMVSWECRSGEPSEKGSRTLLRLHRALLFIIDFSKNLKDSDEGDQISTLCQASYNDTLSRDHSWIIRKLVGVAIHLLVSRDYILKALMKKRGLRNEHEVKQAIIRFIDAAEQVFNRLQKIYEGRSILNLP